MHFKDLEIGKETVKKGQVRAAKPAYKRKEMRVMLTYYVHKPPGERNGPFRSP